MTHIQGQQPPQVPASLVTGLANGNSVTTHELGGGGGHSSNLF